MAEIRAQQIAEQLPASVRKLTVVCPLCGTDAQVRGLRPKHNVTTITHWELVFTCPACGLLSTFDTEGLNVEQIRAITGSYWTKQLRNFAHERPEPEPGSRPAGVREWVSTFAVCYLMWMLFTGSTEITTMLWGVVASIVVAGTTYRFTLLDVPTWVSSPRRWSALGRLALEFIKQLVMQNVALSLRVFRPNMAIKPGIIIIPTRLKRDFPLTVLGSLMTLTPDTVTLDIDQQKGLIYMHWIDVQTTDMEEAQRLIYGDLEDLIIEWLE